MQLSVLRALPTCVTSGARVAGPRFSRTLRTAPAILRQVQGKAGDSSSNVPATTGGGGGGGDAMSLWGPRSSMLSPFRTFRDIEQEMESMMRGLGMPSLSLESPMAARGAMSLAVDVQDKEDHYEIAADLPGLSRDDIKVEVSPDNVLTISGERKAETKSEEGGVVRMERSYGTFTRSFRLPEHVDAENIKAHTAHGVLKLNIPKSPEKEGKKVIKIDIGDGGGEKA